MTNRAFDANGVQFAWDSTSLGLAFSCPRKYQLKMLENWAAKHLSPHLFFGQVYASALEHYHHLCADGVDHESALMTVTHDALKRTWIDGKPWESEHKTKTRENLIRSIVWYLTEFKDDNFKTLLLSDGRPAVELSFRLPLFDDGEGEEIFYCGHLDRAGYLGDARYVQDQKTTGTTVGKYYFEGWSPDIQMSGYTLAGKIIFDIPVKGVMIDAAQIADGFTRFARGFTHRTDSMLEEWLHNVSYKIKEMRAYTQFYRENENAQFPMNYSACGNYGGCEFRSICSESVDHRQAFLQSNFVKRVWDPLETR